MISGRVETTECLQHVRAAFVEPVTCSKIFCRNHLNVLLLCCCIVLLYNLVTF